MMEAVTAPPSSALRETRMADVGELAGSLVHEFNNLLNTWTLHLALLEQQTPGAAADLQGLRQHMKRMTAQVGRFQRYRQGEPPSQTADVAEAARRALEALSLKPQDGLDGIPLTIEAADKAAPGDVAVTLDLPPHPLPVLAYPADLERLFRFLLRNAARGARQGGGTVTLRGAIDNDRILLSLEDTGPAVPEALLPHYFEADQKCRDGMCGLEMAACRSVVRRLSGRMSARHRPGGGIIVDFQLPAELDRSFAVDSSEE